MSRHGTRKRYDRGCRCPECTAANNAYNITYRAQKKAARGAHRQWSTLHTLARRLAACVEQASRFDAYRPNAGAIAIEVDGLLGRLERRIDAEVTRCTVERLAMDLQRKQREAARTAA